MPWTNLYNGTCVTCGQPTSGGLEHCGVHVFAQLAEQTDELLERVRNYQPAQTDEIPATFKDAFRD